MTRKVLHCKFSSYRIIVDIDSTKLNSVNTGGLFYNTTHVLFNIHIKHITKKIDDILNREFDRYYIKLYELRNINTDFESIHMEYYKNNEEYEYGDFIPEYFITDFSSYKNPFRSYNIDINGETFKNTLLLEITKYNKDTTHPIIRHIKNLVFNKDLIYRRIINYSDNSYILVYDIPRRIYNKKYRQKELYFIRECLVNTFNSILGGNYAK